MVENPAGRAAGCTAARLCSPGCNPAACGPRSALPSCGVPPPLAHLLASVTPCCRNTTGLLPRCVLRYLGAWEGARARGASLGGRVSHHVRTPHADGWLSGGPRPVQSAEPVNGGASHVDATAAGGRPRAAGRAPAVRNAVQRQLRSRGAGEAGAACGRLRRRQATRRVAVATPRLARALAGRRTIDGNGKCRPINVRYTRPCRLHAICTHNVSVLCLDLVSLEGVTLRGDAVTQ